MSMKVQIQWIQRRIVEVDNADRFNNMAENSLEWTSCHLKCFTEIAINYEIDRMAIMMLSRTAGEFLLELCFSIITVK